MQDIFNRKDESRMKDDPGHAAVAQDAARACIAMRSPPNGPMGSNRNPSNNLTRSLALPPEYRDDMIHGPGGNVMKAKLVVLGASVAAFSIFGFGGAAQASTCNWSNPDVESVVCDTVVRPAARALCTVISKTNLDCLR